MWLSYFLDGFGLGYILICFPTASVLLLLHRSISSQLAPYHWAAYWLINALLFFIAWQAINTGKDSGYLRAPGRRKVLAAFALPAALLTANLLFLWLLEGRKTSVTIITPLFLILGFVACVTGFVGTRSGPAANWQVKDLNQAKRIQVGTRSIAALFAAAIGGSIASEPFRAAYILIWNSPYLFWGSICVASAVLFTLVIYPWLIVNSMQDELESREIKA